MSYQPMIDTALGLFFIFFAGALITSAVVEWFANLFKKRAKVLLVGIKELLAPSEPTPQIGRPTRLLQVAWNLPANLARASDLYNSSLWAPAASKLRAPAEPLHLRDSPQPDDSPMLAEAARTVEVDDILHHSLVRPFAQARATGAKTRNPSYIPGEVFASALFDQVKRLGGGDSVEAIVDKLAGGSLRDSLKAIASASGGQLPDFLKQVEKWYDAQMDRVNGAYRRWAKKVAILVATLIVGLLHLDAIAIAQDLWKDEALRNAVVASAIDTRCYITPSGSGTPALTGSVTDSTAQHDCVQKQIDALASDGLPIGIQEWRWPADFLSGLRLIFGLTLSVIAISMGAPFWFGVMNKIVNIRNAGNPPKEDSE